MRESARRLFTLCSAVSLLLCVAVCVLWVRSYPVRDDIFFNSIRHHPDGMVTARMSRVMSGGGGLYFETRHCTRADEIAARQRAAALRPDFRWHKWRPGLYPIGASPGSPFWIRWGFLIGTGGHDLLFVVPYWALGLAGLMLPSWWVIRTRRRAWARRAADEHLCRACGYDLRASPDRCPECGTVPAVKGNT